VSRGGPVGDCGDIELEGRYCKRPPAILVLSPAIVALSAVAAPFAVYLAYYLADPVTNHWAVAPVFSLVIVGLLSAVAAALLVRRRPGQPVRVRFQEDGLRVIGSDFERFTPWLSVDAVAHERHGLYAQIGGLHDTYALHVTAATDDALELALRFARDHCDIRNTAWSPNLDFPVFPYARFVVALARASTQLPRWLFMLVVLWYSAVFPAAFIFALEREAATGTRVASVFLVVVSLVGWSLLTRHGRRVARERNPQAPLLARVLLSICVGVPLLVILGFGIWIRIAR
jgi:hypothetical protein